MEKLQAALAKARQKKGRLEETDQTRPARYETRAEDRQSAWDALTMVPLQERVLRKSRIVAGQVGDAATPFDILRTKVLLQMRQHGWTRLAITSPEPNSGKTTTACNLALGLGRQDNLRTILFDFDFNNPSVQAFFGVDVQSGLTEVIRGDVPFDQHAVRVRDNVALSVCAAPDEDPTRLLMADRTAELIDAVQDTYQPDIIIFDLPSMLSGDKARAFLKNSDCALIIAHADRTRFAQLDLCEREVVESQTNVLGVVLNGCRRGGVSGEDSG